MPETAPQQNERINSIILVEPDQSLRARMAVALEHTSVVLHARPEIRIVGEAGSLRELHRLDLDSADLVICAMDLPDGSGIDALAYIRGVEPSKAVLLTGSLIEPALAAEAIRGGALDMLVKSTEFIRLLPLAVQKCMAHQRVRNENDRLQRALHRSLSELADKNTQMRTLISQLESMARTDELTGLSNRRWLNEMLDRAWAEAGRQSEPIAFMMIDLDDFKALNDTHGHQKGDYLLRLVGRLLQANCRAVDIAARYGGDEFCVLMPHTELDEALLVARRVLSEFDEMVNRMPEVASQFGISIGIAHSMVSRPTNAEQMVAHADEAMYAAKLSRQARLLVRQADGASTDVAAA